MFGIDNFSQVSDIIEGHYKEITDQENELYNKRIAICKNCPLFTDKFGGICDSKKYYNSTTNELIDIPKSGFIGGCGCRLQAKTRLKNAKCVLNKW